MVAANHGTIAIISSVAGDRGRKTNYVYGAAKGMVSRYAQGMQHRLSNTNVKVVLIKPGPTDTPMTSNLKAKGFDESEIVALASVEAFGCIWDPKKLDTSNFPKLDNYYYKQLLSGGTNVVL